MKHNRRGMSLPVTILVVTVVGLIIWQIVGGGIGKAFGAVINPLKEKMGFGEDEDSGGDESMGSGGPRGGGSDENIIPLDFPDNPSCTDICREKGKVCIVAIDDGKVTKKCDDDSIRFEEFDDFCVCGYASQKIIPNPRMDLMSTCDSRCSIAGGNPKCIIGIDDGTKPRRCDKSFRFESGDNPPDDYCFCGGTSRDFFPRLASGDEEKTCNYYCGSTPGTSDKCIIGMDDEADGDDGTIRRCNDQFRFESGDNPRDDYCICGEAYTSEKVIPLDFPDNPSCTDICGKNGMECIQGIDDGGTAKECDEPFGFEEADDYCICSSAS